MLAFFRTRSAGRLCGNATAVNRTKAKMDFIERGRLRQKGANSNWLATPWHLSRFVVNSYDSETASLDLGKECQCGRGSVERNNDEIEDCLHYFFVSVVRCVITHCHFPSSLTKTSVALSRVLNSWPMYFALLEVSAVTMVVVPKTRTRTSCESMASWVSAPDRMALRKRTLSMMPPSGSMMIQSSARKVPILSASFLIMACPNSSSTFRTSFSISLRLLCRNIVVAIENARVRSSEYFILSFPLCGQRSPQS